MGENKQGLDDLDDDSKEAELDEYCNAFREKLLRAVHGSLLLGLAKTNHHRPRDCPKRIVRQDPPMCPMCNPLMRTYEELDVKLKDEIWSLCSHILDPAMEEVRSLYERLQYFGVV